MRKTEPTVPVHFWEHAAHLPRICKPSAYSPALVSLFSMSAACKNPLGNLLPEPDFQGPPWGAVGLWGHGSPVLPEAAPTQPPKPTSPLSCSSSSGAWGLPIWASNLGDPPAKPPSLPSSSLLLGHQMRQQTPGGPVSNQPSTYTPPHKLPYPHANPFLRTNASPLGYEVPPDCEHYVRPNRTSWDT